MTLMAAPTLDIFSLEGRVALVTGASSGIGRRMALAFAGVGADIVLVARRRGVLQVAAREIEEATGRHVLCIDVDLAKLTDFEALAALASNRSAGPIFWSTPPGLIIASRGTRLRAIAGTRRSPSISRRHSFG